MPRPRRVLQFDADAVIALRRIGADGRIVGAGLTNAGGGGGIAGLVSGAVSVTGAVVRNATAVPADHTHCTPRIVPAGKVINATVALADLAVSTLIAVGARKNF